MKNSKEMKLMGISTTSAKKALESSKKFYRNANPVIIVTRVKYAGTTNTYITINGVKTNKPLKNYEVYGHYNYNLQPKR